MLEQAVRVRFLPEALQGLPATEAQFIKRLADTQVSVEALGKMSAALSDTIFFIERNAHSKTQLLALAIRLQYIIRGVEIKS